MRGLIILMLLHAARKFISWAGRDEAFLRDHDVTMCFFTSHQGVKRGAIFGDIETLEVLSEAIGRRIADAREELVAAKVAKNSNRAKEG